MRKIYDLWWVFASKRILGEPEPAFYEFPVRSISLISCCGLMFIYAVIGVIPATKHLNSDHIVLLIVTIFYNISLLHFFRRTAGILLNNKYMIDKKKIEDNNPYNNTRDIQRFLEYRFYGLANLHIQPFKGHVSRKQPFDCQQDFSSVAVGTVWNRIIQDHHNSNCEEKPKNQSVIQGGIVVKNNDKQNQSFDHIYDDSPGKNYKSMKDIVHLGNIEVVGIPTESAQGKQSDLNFKTAKLSRIYLRPFAYFNFIRRCLKNISKKGMSELMGQMQKENAKVPGGDNFNNRHQNKQHSFTNLFSLSERFLLIATASFWAPLALLDRKEKQIEMGERKDYDYLREKADMLKIMDAVKAIPILMVHGSIIFTVYHHISVLLKQYGFNFL